LKTEQKKIQRVIQEYVPGKQLTLAHLIANPQPEVARKLGLEETSCGAIGILTITPGEAVIIAADVASKAADVAIGFMDRFGGSLVMTGDTASVEASLREVISLFDATLHFSVVQLTRS
jgi:ethanolamine utilization protein EutS